MRYGATARFRDGNIVERRMIVDERADRLAHEILAVGIEWTGVTFGQHLNGRGHAILVDLSGDGRFVDVRQLLCE